MTVRPGFPAGSGAATFQDIRRSLAGQVVKSAAGVLRTGILPIGTGQLITGTASMVVNVQTCVIVLDRNGAVFLPNDGVQPVQLSSAPSSGSRWSIVYAKQRETEAPFSDAAAGPLIDKVESTTSETAARNLLPAGARELGVWKIDAGVTTTNAASGVTYTETVPYTAMEGGTVLFRNQAERDAWAPHEGSMGYQLDTQRGYEYLGATIGWVHSFGKPEIGAFTSQGIYSAGGSPFRVLGSAGRIAPEGNIVSASAGFTAGDTYTFGSIPAAMAPKTAQIVMGLVNVDGLAEITFTTTGAVTGKFNKSFTGTLNMWINAGGWADKRLV
ncbi:hypothetical protein [uncultured Microbacterium sp.]|uniref:hypothetical protein n=1 Tax=uncultured Microbacterium sp. TaxID=191216 RepID=UPI00374A5244